MIGEAHKVVKTQYIAVEPLMNAKQPQKICRRGVSGGTALVLPESGVEVVTFAGREMEVSEQANPKITVPKVSVLGNYMSA